MVTQIIKLTDAVENQAGFAPFKSTAPVSSGQGISVSFNFYAYGGTGGDGIGFFLVDGNQTTIVPGGVGGSFGYAPRTDLGTPGLAGGYLGIAFDSYGNFSNPTEGRAGGPSRIPNSIAVRGSAAASTPYNYLIGTDTLPIPLNSPLLDRASARRRAQIDLTADGVLTVRLDLNNDLDFDDSGEIPISNFNVAAVNGAVPGTIRFGFAASTGANTDIHEIDDFSVTTLTGTPIGGTFSNDLTFVGGDGNDNATGGEGNDNISGGGGNDIITGGGGNDNATGGDGNDIITGGDGNDIITGGTGIDTVTGGTGGDRFVFAGAGKAAALRSSTLRARDRITDFNQAQGDRFVLEFDNNPQTRTLPKGLFNAGQIRGVGNNLERALRVAYADKNQKTRGNQALKTDEAILFRLGSRTFLSVNDGKAPFSSSNDLVAEVTGIALKSGDARLGQLKAANYFA